MFDVNSSSDEVVDGLQHSTPNQRVNRTRFIDGFKGGCFCECEADICRTDKVNVWSL